MQQPSRGRNEQTRRQGARKSAREREREICTTDNEAGERKLREKVASLAVRLIDFAVASVHALCFSSVALFRFFDERHRRSWRAVGKEDQLEREGAAGPDGGRRRRQRAASLFVFLDKTPPAEATIAASTLSPSSSTGQNPKTTVFGTITHLSGALRSGNGGKAPQRGPGRDVKTRRRESNDSRRRSCRRRRRRHRRRPAARGAHSASRRAQNCRHNDPRTAFEKVEGGERGRRGSARGGLGGENFLFLFLLAKKKPEKSEERRRERWDFFHFFLSTDAFLSSNLFLSHFFFFRAAAALALGPPSAVPIIFGPFLGQGRLTSVSSRHRCIHRADPRSKEREGLGRKPAASS